MRISVGAEDVDDLLDDLGQAFEVGGRVERFGKGRGGGLEQKKGAGRAPWLLRVYSCGGAGVELP
jgi:hypothetical protein